MDWLLVIAVAAGAALGVGATLLVLRRATNRSIAEIEAHVRELADAPTALRPPPRPTSGRRALSGLWDALDQWRQTHLSTLQALLSSDERYALIVDGNRDGIFDRDYRRDQIWFSERAHAIFGLEHGSLNGERIHFLALIHPDDLPDYLVAIEEEILRQSPYLTATIRMRHADGGWRWVMMRGRAIYDAAGLAMRTVGSVTDVTEERAAEAALKQANLDLEARIAERTAHLTKEIADRQLAEENLRGSEEMLRGVMDAIPIGVVLYDEEDRMIFRNQTMQKMSPRANDGGAKTRQDRVRSLLLRTGQLAGVPEDEIELKVSEFNQAVFKTGHVARDLTWDNGLITRYEATLLPGGGCVIIHIDITELKSAQTRLEEQNARLGAEIARREEAERQIRDAEGRLRRIIDAIPVGIVVYDPQGYVIVRNRMINAIFPIPDPHAAIGQHRRDLVQRFVTSTAKTPFASQEELDAAIDAWIAARDAEEGALREFRLRSDLIVTDQNVTLDDGTLISISLDVTNLRRIEFRLKELFRVLPVGIALIDETGVVIDANERLHEIHPNPESWIGRSAMDLLADSAAMTFRREGAPETVERQEQLIANRREAIMDPTRTPSPEHLRTGHGRWVDVVSARSQDGALIQVHQDVTDLRESQRRLEIIIEGISAGIGLVGPDGTLIDLNHRLTTYFPRMTREAAIGAPYAPWVAATDHSATKVHGRPLRPDEVADFVRRRIAQFETGEIDTVTLRARSGRILHSESTRSPDGYIVLSYTDVTEIEQTQEALARSDRMAALGGLVAGVAHEINTPVGIAVTAASHLEELTRTLDQRYRSQSMSRPDLERYLGEALDGARLILKNLERASGLVSSFKRVSVDQTSDERRVFNFRQVLSDTIATLRPNLRHTSHAVTLDCPEDLFVEDYPGLISQIVTNFIMNSLIHAFPEAEMAGRSGEMLIQVTHDRSHPTLLYRDNGVGVPDDVLGKIFDPFFTTARGQGGSGLGLSVVYNIVTQKLGGAISVTSRSGLEFRIELTSRICEGEFE